MIVPRVTLLGDTAAASRWIGVAKNFARNAFNAGLASQTWMVENGTTIRVLNLLREKVCRVVIEAGEPLLRVAFLPHAPIATGATSYNYDPEAKELSDQGLCWLTNPNDFGVCTATAWFAPTPLRESASPDASGTARRAKHNWKAPGVQYGNQSAVRWIYDEAAAVWRTGDELYSWWHSPHGDLKLSMREDIGGFVVHGGISSFQPTDIYSPFIFTITGGSSEPPAEDGSLVYFATKDIYAYSYAINHIPASIYSEGEVIFTLSSGVVAGVFARSPTELIVAAVDNFNDLYFLRLTKDVGAGTWSGVAAGVGYAYEAKTEAGLATYNEPSGGIPYPLVYRGLLWPVRFSQDGTACATLQECWHDTNTPTEPLYKFQRRIVFELDLDESEIVVSTSIANYCADAPLHPTYGFPQADPAYFVDKDIPMAVNYKDNAIVTAYSYTTGSVPVSYLKIGEDSYSMLIDEWAYDMDNYGYYMQYAPHYLDVISRARVLLMTSNAETTYGHYIKVNNEVIDATQYELPFDANGKTLYGFGGSIDHRHIDRLKSGMYPFFVYCVTDNGYAGVEPIVPEIPVLNACISNIRSIRDRLTTFGYPADTILLPVGFV